MARKKLVEVEVVSSQESDVVKLEALVERWGQNKSQADALKKVVDADSAQIKQIMIQEKLDTKKAGDYTAKLSFQNKEVIDEAGVLSYIKSVI